MNVVLLQKVKAGMKPLAKSHFDIARSLFLPLALLAFAILLSRFGAARKEPAEEIPSAEFPYGYTTRVLVDETTGIVNYGVYWHPSISGDGRFVAFQAPSKSYSMESVYVYDRKTGETVYASIGQDGKPVEGGTPIISAEGRYVAFGSNSTNRFNNNNFPIADIMVRDLQSEQTFLVSMAYNEQPADSASYEPSISADGRYVAFESGASNLVKGDTNHLTDIFVYDLKTGEMKRVSVAPDGTQANGASHNGMISGSGRFVAFFSEANNLAAGSLPGMGVYLHDLETGKTVSISAAQGIVVEYATPLAINADGRYVVFLGGHMPKYPQDVEDYGLYLYDRLSGTAEYLVKELKGRLPINLGYAPSISADGRYVAFESTATNLVSGDNAGYNSIFVLDRQTGTIRRVSVSSQNVEADGTSSDPSISADGQHVVFVSEARNLVEGYVHGALGVFIHDLSNWGDYPSIDARRFSQATPYPGPYPPPTNLPPSYPYPYPLP
jgi:Tol biopolymer transport system component